MQWFVYLSGEREELFLQDFHGSLRDDLHFPSVHKFHQEGVVVQQRVQLLDNLSPDPVPANVGCNNLTCEGRESLITGKQELRWGTKYLALGSGWECHR